MLTGTGSLTLHRTVRLHANDVAKALCLAPGFERESTRLIGQI